MVSGLFSLASAVISCTGLIVPSVLETWPTATMRVRGESRFPVGLHIQRLARSQRDYLEDRARAFAEHLPGDDVGVVLTGGQDNFVPRLDRART